MPSIVLIIIETIMDSLEEFFNALTIPTAKFTQDAFYVSLGFLGWSILAEILNIFTFVNWQEAVTCSVITLLLVIIDSSSRDNIKKNVAKIKNLKKANIQIETNELEVDDNE